MGFVAASFLVEDYRTRRHRKVASFQTGFDVEVNIPQSAPFADHILPAEVWLFARDRAAGIHTHIDLNRSRRRACEADGAVDRAGGCRIDDRELGLGRSLTWALLRRHWPGVLTATSREDEGSKGEQKRATIHLRVGQQASISEGVGTNSGKFEFPSQGNSQGIFPGQ